MHLRLVMLCCIAVCCAPVPANLPATCGRVEPKPKSHTVLLAGTSADTSISLLMEPAFVSQSGASSGGGANASASAARPPMYFALPNCSALSDADRATLAQVGQVGAGGVQAVR